MADESDLANFSVEQFFDETFQLEPDLIFENLSALKSSLKELLGSIPSAVVYLTKCLYKVFMGSTKKTKIKVVDFVVDLGLVKHINCFFGVLEKESDDSIISNLDNFLEQLIILCSYFVQHAMGTIDTDELESMIDNIQTAMSEMNARFNIDLPNTLLNDYVNLKQSVIDYRGPKQSKHSKLTSKNQPPPDDFRKLSLYPTVPELNQKELSFLRENVVNGPYDNVDHYLDIHFRLLREDFIERFRRGLRLYRDAKAAAKSTDTLPDRYEQMRIYFKTKFERCRFKDTKSLAYTLNFDVDNKISKSNINPNSMFMYGSLLLLTRDDFRTFFYAIVNHNSLERLSTGRVSVTLQDNIDINDEFFNQTYVMAESDDYFGPYQLVLDVLRKMTAKTFPMVKHIVDVNTKIAMPSYLKKFRDWDLFGHTVNPSDTSSWPSSAEIGLDEYQYRGLVHGLTHSLSIIQGPPGTGKTYLGLKIMEVLLSNMEAHEFYIRAPILVICFTNHALDQFLEETLKYTKNIIRVGGQSQSEALEKFNLTEARAGRARFEDKQSDSVRRQLTATYIQKTDILRDVDKKNEELELLNHPVGIFSYRTLINVMRDAERDKIIGDIDLLLWLLATDKPNYSSDEDSSTDDDRKRAKAGKNGFQYRMQLYLMDNLKNNVNLAADEEDVDLLTYCLTLEEWRSICMKISDEFVTAQFQLSCGDVDEAKRELFSQLKELNERMMPYETVKRFVETDTVNVDAFKKPCADVRRLKISERWALYAYWIGALKKQRYDRLKRLKLDYRICDANNEKLQRRDEANILKNATVVGMTTSGAARRRETLELLKSSVVIVEEAAEVLEAHIIASLVKETEHLIMIGDHQQLRPRTLSYHLRYKYQLDVSLFERLIKNDFECPVLQIQHRMRPEICALITPSIYENLENNPNVLEYGSIEGVKKNLFFLNHSAPEQFLNNTLSLVNHHEAKFICRFSLYLLLQGYSPSQITILVMYNGQLTDLLERKKQFPDMREIRISTVDDYQGEENDIVLLSLVRSNDTGRIGFLNIENRVCVSLSRAKKGLYILGNMNLLARKCGLWRKIKTSLEAQNAIGNSLTLCCKRHGTENEVKEAEDFDRVINGGCNKICDYELECGHKCKFQCHHTDQNHTTRYLCQEAYYRPLPCGHEGMVLCSQQSSDASCCTEIVEYESNVCGHIQKRMCFQKEDASPCDNVCAALLECGHLCSMLCHLDYDPKHEKFKCQETCNRVFVNCPKKHRCSKRCFEKCGDCDIEEMVDLRCGHRIMRQCSDVSKNGKCYQRCLKICPSCHQRCLKTCWECCDPCQNKIEKIIEECGHAVMVTCSETPSLAMCPIDGLKQTNLIFARKLKEFKENNATSYGTEKTKNNAQNVPIGSVDECTQETVYRDDNESCREIMECGHPCSGTYGRCLQGRLHKGCRQYCSKILVCGHKCRNPCRDICLPCEKPSKFVCRHSKSSSESLGKCGAPFSCKEKCEWKCDHESCTKSCEEKCDRGACYEKCSAKLLCGHDCIGFCGEPCPCFCAICDSKIIASKVLGYWTNCRCIFLEDCSHIIESFTIEEHLRNSYLPSCPQCGTPIVSTLRFMNDVKRSYYNTFASINTTYRVDRQTANIIEETMRELQRSDFDNYGLEYLTKIEHFLLRTVRDRAEMSKCSTSPVYFVAKLLIDLGRRLSNLNSEIFEFRTYERGLDLFAFVVRNIKPKSLLTNVQLIDDFRNEMLRFHKVISYCSLIRELRDMNVKKTSEMDKLCVRLEHCLYAEQKYSFDMDSRVDGMFHSLLKITINNDPSIIDEDIIRFVQMDELTEKLRRATLLEDEFGNICDNNYYC